MYITDPEIRDILLTEGYISEEDGAVIDELAIQERLTFGQTALNHNFTTKDLVGQAVAEHFKVPYADLNSHIPSMEQIDRITVGNAKKFRVTLFEETDKNVVVATDLPDKKGLTTMLKGIFKEVPITIKYSLSEDIDRILLKYRDPLHIRLSKLLEKEAGAPELLDEIFEEAMLLKTSDVHFEPYEETFRIRFRVDGVMSEVAFIDRSYYQTILNRIKVQSQMRIDEHYRAQDGAIHYSHNDRKVNMRVSIAPTINGEKITIRILAEYVKNFSFGDIGLSPAQSTVLERAVKKPFGMILVVGPTGSGKTTTLYSLLRLINNVGINITTIEDPVEYKIDGVNQIKVNEATGLTFAKGLRSIVRQDPDVILVGEIRDRETAEIAVNAALTGHLVLSTFHANDAATAIPRLLDMGIEPFLLSSTLELVIGQRLIRKISESCRVSVEKTVSSFEETYPHLVDYFKPERGSKVTLYENTCIEAKDGGYEGREGIFEVIEMTPDLKDLVLEHPSAEQVWEVARRHGAESIFEDGVRKVKQGETTLEELLRVAEPPDKKYDLVTSRKKTKK